MSTKFEIPEIAKEAIKNGVLPVTRISVSAMKDFISNPRIFFKKYIMLNFDIETSGAMLVGSAVHKALEELKKTEIETGEILSLEEVQNIGLIAFRRFVNEYRIKAIAKRLERDDVEVVVPEFYGDMTDEEVLDELTKIEKKFFENKPEIANEPFEDDLIKWGATTPREKCEEQVLLAIKNFLEFDEKIVGIYSSIETEKTLEAAIEDEDGTPLLPLKGVVDRIDEVDGKIEIVDYKVVSKFSDANEVKGNYELQAGAYFLLISHFYAGRKISKMRFIEILKSEPRFILPHDPDRRLLQKDLREICDEHNLGWEKYEKNSELIDKLVFAKILVEEPCVREYIIDFEENPHIVPTFETMIRVILTQLALSAMYDIPFLPNISDFFSGAESYKDFVEEMSGQNIQRDKTKADDYIGF